MVSGGLLTTPLLNQLSAGTTIIGAWSMARKLKSGVTVAFYANPVGGGATNAIGFTGNLVTTSGLTTANMALYGGPGGNTGLSLQDQTGNANHLGRCNSQSLYCPVTTGAGALNAPITCIGGFHAPMFSCGYNGLSVATVANALSTSNAAGGVMPVSYGAATHYFMFAVLRLKSGVPTSSLFGRVGCFQHTGDATDAGSTTSATFGTRANTNTTGAIEGFQNNLALSAGTASTTNPFLFGSVFDGVHNTLYLDRAAQTSVAATGTLGSGGNFGVGNYPGNTTNTTNGVIGADIVEVITGTTLAAGDLALIQANMRVFYQTA
jgi:hypothetical protein